jgi:hypothetical protein
MSNADAWRKLLPWDQDHVSPLGMRPVHLGFQSVCAAVFKLPEQHIRYWMTLNMNKKEKSFKKNFPQS